MVHGLVSIKCPKGHTLPLSYDSNECGCHSKGKPCIIVFCRECVKKLNIESNEKLFQLKIPLDEETTKKILELL